MAGAEKAALQLVIDILRHLDVSGHTVRHKDVEGLAPVVAIVRSEGQPGKQPGPSHAAHHRPDYQAGRAGTDTDDLTELATCTGACSDYGRYARGVGGAGGGRR